MSVPTPPAFLRLKLLTIDDDWGQKLTWRGPVGGRVPLRCTMVLHYDAGLAALQQGAHIEVNLESIKRQYALLSVEPAPDATEVSVEVARVVFLASEPSEPDLGSVFCTAEFEATGKLAADIEQLADWLAQKALTHEVEVGTRIWAN